MDSHDLQVFLIIAEYLNKNELNALMRKFINLDN